MREQVFRALATLKHLIQFVLAEGWRELKPGTPLRFRSPQSPVRTPRVRREGKRHANPGDRRRRGGTDGGF